MMSSSLLFSSTRVAELVIVFGMIVMKSCSWCICIKNIAVFETNDSTGICASIIFFFFLRVLAICFLVMRLWGKLIARSWSFSIQEHYACPSKRMLIFPFGDNRFLWRVISGLTVLLLSEWSVRHHLLMLVSVICETIFPFRFIISWHFTTQNVHLWSTNFILIISLMIWDPQWFDWEEIDDVTEDVIATESNRVSLCGPSTVAWCIVCDVFPILFSTIKKKSSNVMSASSSMHLH